jgi:hypothetical protein
MDEATRARFDSVDACLSEDLARIARNDIRLNQMDGAFSAHIERHEERFNALAMAIEHTVKASLDILSRVEALEAERVAPVQVPPTTIPTPPAAVPSDDELWEVMLKARRHAQPDAGWKGELLDQAEAAHRALHDHGFQRGLAAGRAEQRSTPEPEPDDFQTLHGIALDMVEALRPIVIPEILNTLRRAIRELMAEPTPEPEPNQAPAGDGGLVDTISDIIGNEPIIGRPCPATRAVLFAVAKWLRSVGHSYYVAADLEREAQR